MCILLVAVACSNDGCNDARSCADLLKEGMSDGQVIDRLGGDYTATLRTCGLQTSIPWACRVLTYEYDDDSVLAIAFESIDGVWRLRLFLGLE